MLVDATIGIAVYLALSWLFDKPFDTAVLLAAIIFAHLPDIDAIPYFLLRKRFKLVSHHLIHYPLILIPLGTIALLALCSALYLPLLYALSVTGHFIHDSASVTGIKWLAPFSPRNAYRLEGWRFVRARDREAFYAELRPTISKRTFIDEILMRLEAITVISIILFAFLLVMTFLYAHA